MSQYFAKMRHNLAAPDTFVKVVKLTALHCTVRCQACLILSECNLLDLTVWFRVQTWNPQFYINI